MSEPALPGETALLQVASPAASTRLSNASLLEVRQGDGEWSAVPMSGMTAAGGAFEVPASFAPAAFEVRVDGGSAFAANVPRPWFAFGDLGETATQGGSVRIVGEALTLLRDSTATPPLLRLAPVAAVAPAAAAAAAAAIVLVARASLDGGGVGAALTRWQAYFDLPAALAPGNYSLAIAHGGGSGSDDTGGAAANASAFEPLCTFVDQDRPCRSTIRVTAAGTALADPRTTFGATDTFVVNATQPGAGRDATAAVAAAVAAASAHLAGGAERALVHFPRGQYFVQGPILVAPGTVLRGERRDLVSIYFAEDNATSAPAAYVSSTRPGAWGLEGVTLYVTAFANSIVRFTPGTVGAFLRRSTIRFNSYFCLEPAKGQGSRGRTSGWEHDVGVAVTLAGKSLFVQDNDIFSSGDVVSSRNNGAAGAAYMHISRNRFWNGGTTHWGISWKQCIYEDNEATGVSTTAMGSNYPQYAHSDGEPHVQNILHTNNSQNMVWGNDRGNYVVHGNDCYFSRPLLLCSLTPPLLVSHSPLNRNDDVRWRWGRVLGGRPQRWRRGDAADESHGDAAWWRYVRVVWRSDRRMPPRAGQRGGGADSASKPRPGARPPDVAPRLGAVRCRVRPAPAERRVQWHYRLRRGAHLQRRHALRSTRRAERLGHVRQAEERRASVA